MWELFVILLRWIYRNLQNLVAIGAVEIFTAIGIVATNITLLSVGGEESKIKWEVTY